MEKMMVVQRIFCYGKMDNLMLLIFIFETFQWDNLDACPPFIFVRLRVQFPSIQTTYFISNLIVFAEIPDNEYIKYFAPEYSLKIPHGHIVRSF